MAHVSAAERRPQLIKAAIDLMTSEGVSAGSTRAIAARLGVAQATVHYTFGTKEQLYHAVMQELTRELVASVEHSAPEAGHFDETISAMVSALWQTVLDKPATHQLLIELSMLALRTPSLQEALDSHYRDVRAATTRLLSEAAERTERRLAHSAETIARYFLAGFDGLTLQRLCAPDDDADNAGLAVLVNSVLALADGRLALKTAAST